MVIAWEPLAIYGYHSGDIRRWGCRRSNTSNTLWKELRQIGGLGSKLLPVVSRTLPASYNWPTLPTLPVIHQVTPGTTQITQPTRATRRKEHCTYFACSGIPPTFPTAAEKNGLTRQGKTHISSSFLGCALPMVNIDYGQWR